MNEFVNLVIGGLVTGALYVILASGLTLTYQTSGVFNFGQGGIAFATAYLYFQLNTGQHVPMGPSALISIVLFAPLLGYTLHRVLFRKLRDASVAARMVATIGLLVALPSLCLWIVDVLNVKAHWKLPTAESVFRIPGLGPSPAKHWRTGSGLVLNSDQLAMLAAALVASVLLWVVVRRTRLGLEMRASVSRPTLAALRGVDPDRSSAVSWVLSGALAGLAGVLLGPLFTLAPLQYDTLLFVAIPAVVLGRFRSIPIAMVGGLALGVLQNLAAGYLTIADNITGFTTAVPFIVLFVLLIVLGADRRRRAGTSEDERPPVDHLAGLPVWRRRAPWLLAVAALLFYVGFGADDFWAGLLARGLATGLVMLSFTVVTGVGGMVSLAQSSFVLAGAFTAGILMAHGWPFVPALVAGTVVSVAVGLVVALPTRRLGGLALALATLALGLVGDNLLFQISAISNGSSGWAIGRPKLGPVDTNNPRIMVVVLLVLVGLVVLLIHNLVRSSSGRRMLAVRSSEAGALTAGMAVGRAKLLVFGVSAGIAGFGGVMLASTAGRVTNLDYQVLLGLIWLATTVTFSIRRPAGAILAGMVTVVVPQWLGSVPSSTYLLQVLFGLGAMALAKNPDGMLAIIGERGARGRARRAAVPADEPGSAPLGSAQSGSAQSGSDQAVAAQPSFATAHPVPLAEPAAEAPGAPGAVAVRLTGVRAAYGDAEALHGIDLEVRQGEVLGLLGGNGAGKTTLCHLLGGLLAPTAGTIELFGADVTHWPAHRRSRGGLFLAPEGRGIFPDLTVEENLELWLRTAGERDQAYDAFGVLGDRRGQLAGSLSGGEQQMLTLAPALVRRPDVLIADEPTLGLAPKIVDEIFATFRTLHAAGTTLVVAEEKTRDVLALADRVAFVSVGRVTWVGDTADLDQDRLAEAYLGIAPVGAGAPALEPAARR